MTSIYFARWKPLSSYDRNYCFKSAKRFLKGLLIRAITSNETQSTHVTVADRLHFRTCEISPKIPPCCIYLASCFTFEKSVTSALHVPFETKKSVDVLSPCTMSISSGSLAIYQHMAPMNLSSFFKSASLSGSALEMSWFCWIVCPNNLIVTWLIIEGGRSLKAFFTYFQKYRESSEFCRNVIT